MYLKKIKNIGKTYNNFNNMNIVYLISYINNIIPKYYLNNNN